MTILPFDMGNARYNPIDLPHIRGAYLEGYAARANDRVGNPFAPHTNESFQWWRGYRDCIKDQKLWRLEQ